MLYAGDIFREWGIKFASIICPREAQSARGFCRGGGGGGGGGGAALRYDTGD